MSLGYMGENHGTCEETGKQHGRISRYRGSGMYEKYGSELERPYSVFHVYFLKFLINRLMLIPSEAAYSDILISLL